MIRIYAKFGPKNPKDVARNQADVSTILLEIKVRQSQKQIMMSSILPKNEQKITILSIF